MTYFSNFVYVLLMCILCTFVDAMSCLNGGDSQAKFQYSGILTDDLGQTLSGFQTVPMRFDLYSSVDGIEGDYSQVFESVEVKDGIFSLEVGPCLPNLNQSYFVQLAVNNEDLSSRTKLVTLPVSINSINSEKLSGMTTQELFLKIDESISLVLVDFAQNSLVPAIDELGQNLLNHQSNVNNPHSVTKEQVGLSQVDDVKQLPMTMFQTALGNNDASKIPSSKAVAEYVNSQIATINVTGFELENPDLVMHLTDQTNPHNVSKSQLQLDQVTNVLQLPMSYLQTVVSTTSDMNVPSSSAVATFVNDRFNNQPSKASDAFSATEVSNLKSNSLANGNSPWTSNTLPNGTSSEYLRGDRQFVNIAADQFTAVEVANVKSSALADGSTPWTDKQDTLPAGNTSQYFRGDHTFQTLDKASVGLSLVPNSNIAYSSSIAADQFTTNEVTGLKSGNLANGTSPWLNKENTITEATTGDYFRGDKTFQPLNKGTVGLSNVPNTNIAYSVTIPADQFLVSEVTNLRANKLKDGSTPWANKENALVGGTSSDYLRGDRSFVAIPADQLTGSEINNLKLNYLLDGTSPWTTSEPELGAATSGQVLAGDRVWKQLNPQLVGLGQVKDVNVLESFTQDSGQFISTSKIQANTSFGLKIENQSGQGMLISSNGFIGIKTMDPKHDLDVMGTAHIQDIFGQTASFVSTSIPPLMIGTAPGEQGIAFIVAQSGNVGVQTTNPMYAFEVNGPINVNGQILQNGSPIGQSEGSFLFESDRKTFVNTNSEVDVPSSSAVATYVDQIVYYKGQIPADQLNAAEVGDLKAGKLATGVVPEPLITAATSGEWFRGDKTFVAIPADQLNAAEVGDLKAGKLATGVVPEPLITAATSGEWFRGDKTFVAIPADQLTATEVGDLKAGKLATGVVPEPLITAATSGEWYRGDKTFVAIPADQLSATEVGDLKAGKLATGVVPEPLITAATSGEWYRGDKTFVAIPADQLTGAEVTALKANNLANGTTPWTDALSVTGLTINGGGVDTAQVNDVAVANYFETDYQHGGATKWRFRSQDSISGHRFAIFDASNNELMTFNQGGNIGIGKIPAENLDVVGNGVFSNGLNIGFAGAVTGDRVSIGDTHLHLDYDTGVIPKLNFDNGGDYIGYQRGTDTYYFKSGGTAKMVLDANANLGLGIAAPTSSLHIVSASHAVATLDSSAANTVSNLTLSHNGTTKWSLDSRGSVDGVGVDRLAIYNQGKVSEIATFLQTGSMGIGTYEPTTKLDVDGSGVFRSGLNIGFIGATSPGRLQVTDSNFNLEVSGGSSKITLDANDRIEFNRGTNTYAWFAGGSERMRLNGIGRLGLGIGNPNTALHVVGPNGITVGTSSTQGGQISFGNGNHGIKRNYSGANDIGMYTTAGDIYMSASGAVTDKFVLKGNGNVGVGTTSPTEKLEVAGVIKTNRVKFNDNSSVSDLVAFSAKLNGANQVIAPGLATVTWDAEDFDYGNNFNTGTGTFTTPVKGLYQINASTTLLAVDGNKLVKIEIHIDGALRKESKCSMSVARDITCNSSDLFYISAAKDVIVKVSNGDTVNRNLAFQTHATNFSGFLVRELP